MSDNKKPENPPAFPLVYDGEAGPAFCNDGMSLGDYIAIEAMNAMLSNPSAVQAIANFAGTEGSIEHLAGKSYEISRAMLKTRQS